MTEVEAMTTDIDKLIELAEAIDKAPAAAHRIVAKQKLADQYETVTALCKELKERRLTTALPADVQEIDDPIKLNELAWRIVTKSAALYGNIPEDIDLEEIDIITVEILSHIKSTPNVETPLTSADLIEAGSTNAVQSSVTKYRGAPPFQCEDETSPEVIARRWMKASFPNSPIFENRVRSLADKLRCFYELGIKSTRMSEDELVNIIRRECDLGELHNAVRIAKAIVEAMRDGN